ncbi:MAG: recombinase family protein [Pseudonocardiaceae bacterium]
MRSPLRAASRCFRRRRPGSLTEGFDTTTTAGKILFHVLGSLAEFERDLIRERTNAGLAAARAGPGDGVRSSPSDSLPPRDR